MAFDEDLADLVRGLIAPLSAFEESKMFGLLAFTSTPAWRAGWSGTTSW